MENDAVYIEIDPHDVNYVNRILESYEYLGVLTTLDTRRAVCCIHSTADTKTKCGRSSPASISPSASSRKKKRRLSGNKK